MHKYKAGEYDYKVRYWVDVDLFESVLTVCIFTTIILCAGEPDIIDAVVCWLMDTCHEIKF